MKSFLKTLGLFSIGVCVALVLSETIIRIVAPQRLSSGRSRVESDDYLVYKLAKNQSVTYTLEEFQVTEATNSLGLRDHEIGPKTPGTYWFLGLGDSFSFASGVELEQTYFKRLEASLSASWGKPVEVVNAAVWGYSLLQEVRYLKKYGKVFEPDAVIIGYYVGNDFFDSIDLFDSLGRPTVTVKDGNLISQVIPDDPNPIRNLTAGLRAFLAAHSHLYCFLRDRLSDLLFRFGWSNPPPVPDFCAKEFDQHLQKGWELNQGLFREARDFARANKMRLIVVILPAIYQVYEDLWYQEIDHLKIDRNLYDLERPQRLVAEFCARNQIECVDLLPALRAKRKEGALFFRIDSHPSVKGHLVIADSLTQYFTEYADPRWAVRE